MSQNEVDSSKQDAINVREDFDQLCSELNIDQATIEAAWNDFVAIKQKYTLEVCSRDS